jgi:HEPN domain-containing protein
LADLAEPNLRALRAADRTNVVFRRREASARWKQFAFVRLTDEPSNALFFGHLAVEKLLKAVCVLRKKEHAPPIHNLPRLARMAGIALSPERREQLVQITSFNIEARYPDLKRSFRNKCTREFAFEQINGIKDVMKWLRETMTLKK